MGAFSVAHRNPRGLSGRLSSTSSLGRRLSNVGSLLARDDDGALSLSPCLTEVLFAECTGDTCILSIASLLHLLRHSKAFLRVEFYTSSQWDMQLFSASCSPSFMGIPLRMRRSLLGHWGSAEEFPIAPESPWGWALSRFPSIHPD
ncbi:hypothetical protein R3P38DRAFT_3223936 [Favolaschia claudopus]|uniref:Uncharacterized protein n=1 Tax=Favolaschia claudopus TaxID=2862362 RepID=A0AAV9ZXY4_9AGAR